MPLPPPRLTSSSSTFSCVSGKSWVGAWTKPTARSSYSSPPRSLHGPTLTSAPAFTAAWKTALVYLAHLDELNTRLAPAMGRVALLPLWSTLPVQGENSLYAQLFLTPSVLNNDMGLRRSKRPFPNPAIRPGAAAQQHSPRTWPPIQGVFGLTRRDEHHRRFFADDQRAAAVRRLP